jgi:hypothetical protein
MTLIAYCGIDCSTCPTYLATQSDDRHELERLAAMRRKNYGDPGITADSIICDGCTVCGRLSGTCAVCPIRNCAITRSLETCGQCDEYDSCGKLPMVHTHVPEAKAVLDALRS